MGWLDKLNPTSLLIGGASLLGNLLGGGDTQVDPYAQRQAELAGMYGQQATQYTPWVNSTLRSIVANGGMTPWLKAQQAKSEADIGAYYNKAGQDAQMALDEQGLGNSSMRLRTAQDTARARSQALATSRINLVGLTDQRVWDALDRLGGNANSAGQMALGGYGQASGAYQQANAQGNAENDALSQLLAELAKQYGNGQYQTGTHSYDYSNTPWF
jgi:hypothetical protein